MKNIFSGLKSETKKIFGYLLNRQNIKGKRKTKQERGQFSMRDSKMESKKKKQESESNKQVFDDFKLSKQEKSARETKNSNLKRSRTKKK